MPDVWQSEAAIGERVDLHDYLRILRTHWIVIVTATMIGAAFGGLLSFLNRPEPVASSQTPFVSTVEATLLSEMGRSNLANRLSDLTTTTVRSVLAVDSPNPQLTEVDYAQILMSEPTLVAAAIQLNIDPKEFADRVQAVADPDNATITVTLNGAGRGAARSETLAIIEAFSDVVRQGTSLDASTKILITTQTPNPDLETSASYTASRMPTYAGLATSDVVLAPVAARQGITVNSLRDALTVRIEPQTNILSIGVSDLSGAAAASATTRQVSVSLRSAIESIETTPVQFQDLGSSTQDTGTRVRALSLSISEPEVIANADGTVPSATVVSTLSTLVDEIPTTVASGLGTNADAFTDRELEQIAELVGGSGVQVDDFAVNLAPVGSSSDRPFAPATVRITATSTTQESADATAAAAVQVLGARTVTDATNQSWPLALVPTAIIATSEVLPTRQTSSARPVDRGATNIIFGLLIGLALGMGYALLASSRDKTIYSPRQLWEATGEPAFGVIPTSTQTNTWAAVSEHELGGEGYRALRSNVLLGLKDTTVVALVSPTSGTGTHTVGVNLGISLARAGASVCIIETALAQPRLAQLLNVQPSVGLAEAIAGITDISSATTRVEDFGFDLIAAGKATNEVTDTLTSLRFREILEDVRSRYDTVLVLCAPAVDSPEASTVTPLCDTTLITIRVATTSMIDLEITARVLLQVGTKIGGVIANDVPREHTHQWRRYLPPAKPQMA